MPPRPRVDQFRRAASGLAVAGSLLYLIVYAGIALTRMRYPFELEWMEGGMVEHVRRILEGRPIYGKPSLEFVSFLYPPLYYAVAAAVSSLTGLGFFPLRLVSFVSSLGVFALLFALARKETGSSVAGVVAAGLFAAAYDRLDGWFDLARLDSFYLAVLLTGVFVLRHARWRGSAIVAGLLFGAAFLTKQSAIVVLLPLLAYAFLADRRRAVAVGVSAGLGAGGAVALLDHLTGHWFLYYCFDLPSQHPIAPGGSLWFWTRDLLPALPLGFLLALVCVATRLSARGERTRLFLPALGLALVASSWSVRNVYGAEVNNLFPSFAAVALLAAIGAHEIRGRIAGFLGPLLILVQLAMLAYHPAAHLPLAMDREAGNRLVARIAAIDGEVFVPHHGYLARMAGKNATAHTLAMDNVFLDDTGPARRDLEEEVVRALAQRRFGAALVESDRRYASWILAGYELRERLFDRPDVFWPVSGGRLRPEALATPRPGDDGARRTR